MDNPEQLDSSIDKDLLHLSRSRFTKCVSAENENREEALEDLKFRVGEQWPADVKNLRDIEQRPCLTVNRVPQFLRQITNDQRQNRPAIKTSPVDDMADLDTAKVLQGLIRHIEYNSNADVAYDTAFDGAASSGLGYFRILTDYLDPMSFDQEILIKRIRNRFTVYKDPNSEEPDGSDMEYCFISDLMSHDEYKATFPDAEHVTAEDWSSIGDQLPLWFSDTDVRIVEYFYKILERKEIHLLSNGAVVLDEQLEKLNLEEIGAKVTKSRETIIPTIKWCKHNGMEVLEKTDWPGLWIPIVPVLGDEVDVNGKVHLEGIIRHMKDSQRMYNYWVSAETETIALAPRAPFIGAEGQFEGHENDWATANTKSHAFLEYKPKSNAGRPVPPPTRNAFEPPVQAITQARMLASEDLKGTTGIYDPALGAQSRETSGIAIQRRNIQAQTSNFHFVDNLSRSLRHAGRILLDLIPKIYDTPRTIRIIGENQDEKLVKINQMFKEGGKEKKYDFATGRYDVRVETGPSYATKRQEALDSMIALVNAYPQMAQFISDLLVKTMDWPGAQEIAERLKKTIPPEMLDEQDGEKKPIPPEVQQQMQQMSQMVEVLTQQLNEANETINTKKLELESKERIEFAKMEIDVEKEIAKQDAAAAQTLFQEDLRQIDAHQQRIEAQNAPQGAQPNAGAGPNEAGAPGVIQ